MHHAAHIALLLHNLKTQTSDFSLIFTHFGYSFRYLLLNGNMSKTDQLTASRQCVMLQLTAIAVG